MALCAGWRGERTFELMSEDAYSTLHVPAGRRPRDALSPAALWLRALRRQRRAHLPAKGVIDRPVRAGQTFTTDREVIHEPVNIGVETTNYLIVEKKYADQRPQSARAPGLCES
jgi:hypothetical protein